jgi:hypothetical protein
VKVSVYKTDKKYPFKKGWKLPVYETGEIATFFFTDKKESSQRKSRSSIAGAAATQSPWGLTCCKLNLQYLSKLMILGTFPLQNKTLTTGCGKTLLVYPRRSDIVSELPFV